VPVTRELLDGFGAFPLLQGVPRLARYCGELLHRPVRAFAFGVWFVRFSTQWCPRPYFVVIRYSTGERESKQAPVGWDRSGAGANLRIRQPRTGGASLFAVFVGKC